MDFFLGERSMVGFGDEEKTDDPHGFGEALERLTLEPFKKWTLEQGQDIKRVHDGLAEGEELIGLLSRAFYMGISTVFAQCPEALSAWTKYQCEEMGVDPLELFENDAPPPEKKLRQYDRYVVYKTAGLISRAYNALGSLQNAQGDLDVDFHANDARKLLGALQQRLAILEDCVKDLESKP